MKKSYRMLCAATAVICGAWFVLCGSGCEKDPNYVPPPKPDQLTPTVAEKQIEGTRFTVEVVATFDDSLAYRGERRIYLIHDHVTGAEYVGVTGVGITETGTHTVTTTTRAGKSTITTTRQVPDER